VPAGGAITSLLSGYKPDDPENDIRSHPQEDDQKDADPRSGVIGRLAGLEIETLAISRSCTGAARDACDNPDEEKHVDD